MRSEAPSPLNELPDGYPAPPVLSLGVARLVGYPEANWDSRLWDVAVMSDAAEVLWITGTLRTFAVHLDRGLPSERVEQLIREDVDGVPHLYLLAEWNETRKPFILLPRAA
jgi:hypothetical protein